MNEEIRSRLSKMKERIRRINEEASAAGMTKTPEQSAFDRGYLYAVIELETLLDLHHDTGPMYGA